VEIATRWGILGGMGPLASAEFLRTIYECGTAREQDLPVVIVVSDPKFPDRTECLQRGTSGELLDRFAAGLQTLLSAGCTRIVICCMTLHALLPLLPRELKESVLSVPQILLREAGKAEGRFLMLCSEGCRQAQLFETQPLWSSAAHAIVFPDPDDQKRIHQMIYRIKKNQCSQPEFALLRELAIKYDAGFLAGCSEIHILLKRIGEVSGHAGFAFIDPFRVIAGEIRQSGS
jgi:aspartate racemase